MAHETSDRRRAWVVFALALAVIGAAGWWLTSATPPAEPVVVAAEVVTVRPGGQPPTPRGSGADGPAAGPWRAKHDRIRAARLRRFRASGHDADAPEPCADGCWGTVQLQLRLAETLEGCRELLDPEVRGTVRYEAKVVAEPGVGSVVEAVRVIDDEIESEPFNTCVMESARLAELADPEQPVSDVFVFRTSAGPPGDNAADFLRDHPEVAEAHPELAAILDRPLDAPRSGEDATAFAQALSTDETALAAFSQWSAEQGVDLSGVRTDP
jgi:hypothetical protein